MLGTADGLLELGVGTELGLDTGLGDQVHCFVGLGAAAGVVAGALDGMLAGLEDDGVLLG